jgi:hypothetical protein
MPNHSLDSTDTAARGLNLVITPKHIPTGDTVCRIETSVAHLLLGTAEEFRYETAYFEEGTSSETQPQPLEMSCTERALGQQGHLNSIGRWGNATAILDYLGLLSQRLLSNPHSRCSLVVP